MDGYFIGLVVVGKKELDETEMILPTFSNYVQELYKKTQFSVGGKWLMINVTDSKRLEDMQTLIRIRVTPKTK